MNFLYNYHVSLHLYCFVGCKVSRVEQQKLKGHNLVRNYSKCSPYKIIVLLNNKPHLCNALKEF